MAEKDKLKKLREEQEKILARIQQVIYNNLLLSLKIPGVKNAIKEGNDVFSFGKNPGANREMNKYLRDMAKRIDMLLLNGIERSWKTGSDNAWDKVQLAFSKDARQRKELDRIRDTATKSARDNAAKSFYNEKRAGLSVSDRVWNLAGNSKKEMEVIIQNGIKEGKSAEDLQKKLKQYLNEPDKLFRRVTNKETGELEWSKAAKQYHPGQGVYRSSYKNAMRLARTEMNAAYRQAEWESYQSNPLIVGYKIMLSNNHTTLINGVPTPFHCICDDLQGDYPKSFKWLGWHPQCRCTMSPIQITGKEFEDRMRARINGTLDQWKPTSVSSPPKAFDEWVEKNRDRITKANQRGSLPYWIQDNVDLVGIDVVNNKKAP